MHRDLKPENFLFANEDENAPLKAIDFGLSTFFEPGKYALVNEYMRLDSVTCLSSLVFAGNLYSFI